ncbi:hypothetical protein C8Q76DRAFT_790222 [Earliella scabrosa]|nr:hypothetical protein C8Q76DRAFT_790222 [Earliella scabrosa]
MTPHSDTPTAAKITRPCYIVNRPVIRASLHQRDADLTSNAPRLPPELTEFITDDLNILDVLAWRATCRSTYRRVAESLRSFLRRSLTPAHDTPSTLLSLLYKYRILIGGEVALNFVLRDPSYQYSSLELYAPCPWYPPFVDALRELLGTSIARETYINRARYGFIDWHECAYITLQNGFKIAVYQSPTPSALSALCRQPCSLLINYVTTYSFGCAYPHLTLQRQGLLADWALHVTTPLDFQIMNSLSDQGFNISWKPADLELADSPRTSGALRLRSVSDSAALHTHTPSYPEHSSPVNEATDATDMHITPQTEDDVAHNTNPDLAASTDDDRYRPIASYSPFQFSDTGRALPYAVHQRGHMHPSVLPIFPRSIPKQPHTAVSAPPRHLPFQQPVDTRTKTPTSNPPDRTGTLSRSQSAPPLSPPMNHTLPSTDVLHTETIAHTTQHLLQSSSTVTIPEHPSLPSTPIPNGHSPLPSLHTQDALGDRTPGSASTHSNDIAPTTDYDHDRIHMPIPTYALATPVLHPPIEDDNNNDMFSASTPSSNSADDIDIYSDLHSPVYELPATHSHRFRSSWGAPPSWESGMWDYQRPKRPCYVEQNMCPQQFRYFGDPPSLIDFIDPLSGDRERVEEQCMPPMGTVVIWKLFSSYQCCHKGLCGCIVPSYSYERDNNLYLASMPGQNTFDRSDPRKHPPITTHWWEY